MIAGYLRSLRERETHPNGALILSYHDGELSPRRARRTRRHLEKCPTCQIELATLDKNLANLNQWAGSSESNITELRSGLRQLQGSLRIWNAANLPDDVLEYRSRFARLDLRRHVEAELEIYLGQNGTARILNMTSETTLDEKSLLATVYPVLRAFLGQETASAVENRISHIFSIEQPSDPGAAPTCVSGR